jgi:ATP-dependent Zn protease
MEQKMKKRRNILTPILYIVLIFVVIFAASTLLSGMNKAEKLSYSQIIELFEKDQVKEFYVEENGKLTLTTTDGKKITRTLLVFSVFRDDIDTYLDNASLEKYDYAEPSQNSWIINILPTVLMTVLMVVFGIMLM